MTSRSERFWAKVDKSGDCWEWTARRLPSGYGRFGSTGYAHRFSYELAHGKIPDGLTIDHLCFNTSCVNPSHLEAVTIGENLRRRAARVTHCPRGHAYDEVNTYVTRAGHRLCKRCSRDRDALRPSGWERQRRAEATA